MKIYLNFSEKKPLSQLAYLCCIMCFGFLLAIIFQRFISLVFFKNQFDIFNNINIFKVVLLVSQICIFLFTALFFGYYYSNDTLNNNLLIKQTEVKNYVYAFVILLLAIPVVAWLSTLNQNINFPSEYQELKNQLIKQEEEQKNIIMKLLTFNNFGDFVFSFFIMSVAPAVCEELFFRSVLGKIIFLISKRLWTSIIITAIIFSFFHFQFLGFLPRLLLGILLSFIFILSNSILPSIFFHLIFNGMQIFSVYIGGKQYLEKSLNNNSINIPNYLGVISLLLLSLVIFYIYKKNKSKFLNYNIKVQ